MGDPTGEVAERGAFGRAGAEAGAAAAPVARHTWQDERPSRPQAADAYEGTAHKPPELDRPPPSEEPLSVRFEREE